MIFPIVCTLCAGAKRPSLCEISKQKLMLSACQNGGFVSYTTEMGMPMPIQLIATSLFDAPPTWTSDWAWGVPLIVLMVFIHVLGLVTIRQTALQAFDRLTQPHPTFAFAVVIGIVTLLITCLHVVEATVWALAYVFLGAIPEYRAAILYSLDAITTYGHTNLPLEDHWRLMGALEALNGCLLFGLSTAFLFATFVKVWSLNVGKS